MTKITHAHGTGGQYTHDLIKNVFVRHFNNAQLNALLDSAILTAPSRQLVFTTDTHVVQPRFFPGGDIGRLAVAGTINDLAVCGARPLWLSTAFIIEEGFDLDELEKIVSSMQTTASAAGVSIVTGDTKVVNKGEADGVFITTAGIGIKLYSQPLEPARMAPGDSILISGYIGDHAAAIIKARQLFDIDLSVESDCAPLNSLTELLCSRLATIKIMRDPTRGGVATTLNEFVAGGACGIRIYEDKLPVRSAVLGLCEPLGFDPLYLANEGKLIIVISSAESDVCLDLLRSHPLGKHAAIIGEVVAQPSGRVLLRTTIGSNRVLEMLTGEMLPRIC